MLIVHAAAAVAVIRLLWSGVLPAIEPASSDDTRATVCDLWLPIALAAPFAASVAHSLESPTSWNFAGVSGPVCIAAMGAGLSLLVPRHACAPVIASPVFGVAMLGVTAAILLLQAAADRLTVGAGQTMFASAIVLLWINTPDGRDSARTLGDTASTPGPAERPDPAHPRGESIPNKSHAPAALLGIVGLSVAQAILVHQLDRSPYLGTAMSTSFIEASIVLAVLSAAAPAASSRVAAWTGAYGVLLSVGILSVTRLSGAATALFSDDPDAAITAVSFGVASGFARVAPEGAVLAATATVLLAGQRLPPSGRVASGLALGLAAAALMAFRAAGY